MGILPSRGRRFIYNAVLQQINVEYKYISLLQTLKNKFML